MARKDWRLFVRSKEMKAQHIGSDFDDFLREECLFDVVEATAVKRVIAFQIAQELNRRKGPQVSGDESDEDCLVETTS
jgi:hypothetical protein